MSISGDWDTILYLLSRLPYRYFHWIGLGGVFINTYFLVKMEIDVKCDGHYIGTFLALFALYPYSSEISYWCGFAQEGCFDVCVSFEFWVDPIFNKYNIISQYPLIDIYLVL